MGERRSTVLLGTCLQVLLGFSLGVCGISCGKDPYCDTIERCLDLLPEDRYYNHPAQDNLLTLLSYATPDDCYRDRNRDGIPAGREVLDFVGSSLGKDAHRYFGQSRWSEPLLEWLDNQCVSFRSEARFLKLIFTVARTTPPLLDFGSLLKSINDPKAEFYISDLIGPLVNIIHPGTPCSDGGLAECGKDVSDAVRNMGEGIRETHVMGETLVRQGDDTINLAGIYNEPVFRILAAVGSMLPAMLYFLAAHVDADHALSTAGDLVLGDADLDFDTPGEVLTTLGNIDGLLFTFFEAPMNANGSDYLAKSRESVMTAVGWIVGDSMKRPVLIESLGSQMAEGLGIRLIDNGDHRVGACDQIQLNLAFAPDLLKDYYDPDASKGCDGAVAPNAFQLPRIASGDVVDYENLFPAVTNALLNFSRAVQGSHLPFSFEDLNPVLTAAGSSPLPPVARFFPAVLFDKGFSVFTPEIVGGESTIRLHMEVEVNRDAPGCPDGRSNRNEWVCKSKDAALDWSTAISHGDSDHFGGSLPSDNIFLSEEVLDLYGYETNGFFRAARGGGVLPYFRFKDPTVGGFMQVDEGFIAGMTNDSKPLCQRSMSESLTGRMVPTDERFLNALLNFAILEGKVCGNSALSSIENSLFGFEPIDLSLDFGCEGFDLGCSPEFDLDCEMDDFIPSCSWDDLSCRQVVPIHSARTRGIVGTLFVNLAVFLAPMIVFGVLRRARRRKK